MEKNSSSHLISSLEELKSLIRRIGSQNQLSRIDLDLALAKTRTIYDDLLRMEKSAPDEGKSEITGESAPKDTKTKKEKMDGEKEKRRQGETAPSLFDQKTERDIELLKDIPDNKPEPIPVAEKESISVAETQLTEKKEKTAVSEKIQGQQQTVHDLFSQFGNEKDLGTRLQYKPITNLKTAISLNDKVLFVRELFDNNNEAFAEAVSALNALSDLDEAMDYINTHFKWDSSKESFNKFLELVYRRFLVVNKD